jgi:protoheme IX farnesyltransferase
MSLPAAGGLAAYLSLLKVRPMSAVTYSAVIGYAVAPGAAASLTGVLAVLCIALGGGGAAALNMWYEADLDARMRRTRGRATVSGAVRARLALLIGSLLCIGSALAMWWLAGGAAAAMLAATMGAYFGLYTVALKRWTPHAVTVGGALAGVLTPLTGWVAATGRLDGAALALFAYVFFWTPPHVWAQALHRSGDYAKAGIPVLPVVIGASASARWIFGYTILHALLALLPVALGEAGLLYGIVAAGFGLHLARHALALTRTPDAESVQRLSWPFFRLSILYLLTLLTTLAVDRVFLA